ncbi:hypothetical protein D1T48_gp20 [Thermoproteus tenax virus 1]|uniref:Uncharacterized 16.5 kDa protein n=1 Tax=Thermoproteus tenax virus 1 (strain KRA1) TaxID=10480 RepID=YORI_TTV1K|nr:hypothetical protein D1T48_gp20 [Thermoproteus tenax virus 1]P19293.1 RecName: Full=Uncharacterized 16.5 kDa protein [Thermoproteus tenax virus 1 (STRAIN KRA1)]CAA32988.1 unnamed protein product [Thermoproteus tenax virus 1]
MITSNITTNAINQVDPKAVQTGLKIFRILKKIREGQVDVNEIDSLPFAKEFYIKTGRSLGKLIQDMMGSDPDKALELFLGAFMRGEELNKAIQFHKELIAELSKEDGADLCTKVNRVLEKYGSRIDCENAEMSVEMAERLVREIIE